jgi:hypothetical protein
METQQTNSAVVTIQDTVVELDRLLELYRQFDPEKAVSTLTQNQIEQIGRELYQKAFIDNSLGSLSRYVASEIAKSFTVGTDDPKSYEKGQANFVYHLVTQIEVSQEFKRAVVRGLVDHCLNSDNDFVSVLTDRVMDKVVERMKTSMFKLTSISDKTD